MKKLTYAELEEKMGLRHITGAIHFTDGDFVTFFNASISQIISYIKISTKEFKYFVTK